VADVRVVGGCLQLLMLADESSLNAVANDRHNE